MDDNDDPVETGQDGMTAKQRHIFRVAFGFFIVTGGMLLVMAALNPETGRLSTPADEAAISAQPEPLTPEEEGARDAAEDMAAAAKTPASNWTYREERDELRGSTSIEASTTSTNAQSFGFPYGGGSSLRMFVRKDPRLGTDVAFRISPGQFMCGVEGCSGTISIDGKVERLSLSMPADYSPDLLFATYGKAMARKLEKSSTVIVELPFYQEGSRQFKFKTDGLELP